MAIPRQTFRISLINGKFISIQNNYFLPLIKERQAIIDYLKCSGGDITEENINLFKAEEIKENEKAI